MPRIGQSRPYFVGIRDGVHRGAPPALVGEAPSGIPLPRVLSALAHPGKRPGRRGPMPGTLPKKRPRKDPDDEPTVEYTPRLSAARRRAKRVGKVSELPAVGAVSEDAALLYDVVATAELDAARTPPSTDAEECEDDALALMALSRS